MTLYFIILFPLIIINSLLVITSKNSVTSVLYLISVFILVSLNLIFIGAEFIAILIIIIYIGAISILFLFVIMMLNLRILEVYSTLVNILPIASFLGLFIFIELYYTITKEYYLLNYVYNNYFEYNLINNSLVLSMSNLYLIGDLLFNHYNLILIIVGLILLVAMLGAIILTKDFNNSNEKRQKKLVKSMITFWGLKNKKKYIK
jgi:NADH:ubiquinone oxidoreductase subunit 6 (subunit J)